MKRIITRVQVAAKTNLGRTCTFGFVSDLHNGIYQDWLLSLRGVDAILVAGDMLDRHKKGMEHACGFLRDAPAIAPVFLSLGNHETRSEDWPAFEKVLRASRVHLLDDQIMDYHGITIGGLSSREKDSHRIEPDMIPGMTHFVDVMASYPGYKILLCHHPEYYDPCIRGHGIDLTLSGHAHGGQVQLLGQGIYAPGQGLFPKYTDGFYDEKHLLVNRGVTNSTWAPRLWNPCEMILLTVNY